MNMDMLTRLLRPIERRIKLMATRAVVTLVDPARMMQELQVRCMSDNPLDRIEHFEPYGYTSHAHPGAEVIMGALGGRRSHSVAVCVADRRFRLKGLQGGEVALFTDEGDVIHFKRGNHIYVDAMNQVTAKAGTRVLINAPLAEFTGNVKVAGNIEADGEITDLAATSGSSMSTMRTTYNSHDHPGDSGGTTGSPNQAM